MKDAGGPAAMRERLQPRSINASAGATLQLRIAADAWRSERKRRTVGTTIRRDGSAMSSLLWPIFVLIFLRLGRRCGAVGLSRLHDRRHEFQPRLAVSATAGAQARVLEQASVDSKRKLVLIRRDDVEHLIMTGGPVDVVIETGIASRRENAELRGTSLAPSAEPAPRCSRAQPRTFGQAVNE